MPYGQRSSPRVQLVNGNKSHLTKGGGGGKEYLLAQTRRQNKTHFSWSFEVVLCKEVGIHGFQISQDLSLPWGKGEEEEGEGRGEKDEVNPFRSNTRDLTANAS